MAGMNSGYGRCFGIRPVSLCTGFVLRWAGYSQVSLYFEKNSGGGRPAASSKNQSWSEQDYNMENWS